MRTIWDLGLKDLGTYVEVFEDDEYSDFRTGVLLDFGEEINYSLLDDGTVERTVHREAFIGKDRYYTQYHEDIIDREGNNEG